MNDDVGKSGESSSASSVSAESGAPTQPFDEFNRRRGTGSGRLDVRCPSCHSSIDVAVDTELTDLTCTSCGSHFSLIDQSQATRIAPSLSKLGRFELIERLGVGGYGSVWKARDKELDRTVAIKIPRAGGMSAEEQEKFFREARAAAQLRHPGIVSVYEVGRDGDSVYIVSDFVRGVTLGDWLTGQQPTSREAAELCVKIAGALHHAHEQGVVHRDLKPANIIIDGEGEPHLMDFGLARREVGEITVTLDGHVLGTPAYMSPEQARGESHAADRRSDVYSLGVILFQVLTGELPFRGNARMMMHQVIHDEPPSPRKLNGNISKDLETITLKCLEKDPVRRYATANEVADELRRQHANEPINARPISRGERAVRWVRRNKTVSGLLSVVALVLVVGTIVSTYFAIDARRQADIAIAREEEAIAAKRQADDARVEESRARKEAEAVSNFLVNAIQSPDAARYGRAITVAEFLERAAKSVARELPDQPLTRAKLLSAIGSAQVSLGLPHLAAESFNKAKVLYQESLADDHPQTLTAINNLALAYDQAGRFSDAIPLHEQVLTIKRKKLSEDDPDTLTTMNNLACAYCSAGRFAEAIPILEQTLKARRQKLDDDSPDTRTSLSNLAVAYARVGRSSEAIPLHEQVLAACRKKLGANHPDTLLSMNNVATAYFGAGRVDEAIPILEKTLAARREKLGPTHPATLTTMNTLGRAYDKVGRLTEALPLLQQTADARREHLGPEHPDTLNSIGQLAYVNRRAGNVEEAIGLYEETLAGRRKKLGPDHPDTLMTMNNLAVAYGKSNRDDDAISMYKEVLAARQKKLGPLHADTLYSMNSLATTYIKLGRLDNAAQLSKQMFEHGLFVKGVALAIKIGPDAVDQMIQLALAHRGEQTPEPNDALLLGELRLLAGDAASAETAVRAAISRDNTKNYFHKSLGWCLLVQRKNDESKQAFQNVLKNRRHDDGAYDLEKAGPDDMTAAYFLDLISQQKYVEHLAGDKKLACFPWFYVAQRREIEGKQDAAIAAYQRCVDVGDDNSHTVRALAQWRLSKLQPALDGKK